MPDSAAPTEVRYPSRRSLRNAAQDQRTGAPQQPLSSSAPPAMTGARPRAAAAAQDATSTPRIETTPTGSLRLPATAHVPDSRPCAQQSAPKQPITWRRRAGAVAATLSVAGLVAVFALPMTEQVALAETSSAQSQRLFSSIDFPAGEIPEELRNITAVASDESQPLAFEFRPEALVNYPFKQQVLLTDGFGYRTAPVEQFHDAQDFAAAAGTPVSAIADGTVLEAGFASDGCGFGLKLEHTIDGEEVTSRYCHMQENSHDLAVGDEVKMGDQVGSVGNTGMSFGPHLHLALRVDDEPVDPLPFLAKYSRMDRDDAGDEKRDASAL